MELKNTARSTYLSSQTSFLSWLFPSLIIPWNTCKNNCTSLIAGARLCIHLQISFSFWLLCFGYDYVNLNDHFKFFLWIYVDDFYIFCFRIPFWSSMEWWKLDSRWLQARCTILLWRQLRVGRRLSMKRKSGWNHGWTSRNCKNLSLLAMRLQMPRAQV